MLTEAMPPCRPIQAVLRRQRGAAAFAQMTTANVSEAQCSATTTDVVPGRFSTKNVFVAPGNSDKLGTYDVPGAHDTTTAAAASPSALHPDPHFPRNRRCASMRAAAHGRHTRTMEPMPRMPNISPIPLGGC